jgi:hypothetical protein
MAQNMISSELKQRLEVRNITAMKHALRPVAASATTTVTRTPDVPKPEYKTMVSRRPSNETSHATVVADKLVHHQVSAPPPVPMPSNFNAPPTDRHARDNAAVDSSARDRDIDNDVGKSVVPSDTSMAMKELSIVHDNSKADTAEMRSSGDDNENVAGNRTALALDKATGPAARGCGVERWTCELEADAASVVVVERLPSDTVRTRTLAYLSPQVSNRRGNGDDNDDDEAEFAALRKAQRNMLRKEAEEVQQARAQRRALSAQHQALASSGSVDTDALIHKARRRSGVVSHASALLSGERMNVGQSSASSLQVRPFGQSASTAESGLTGKQRPTDHAHTGSMSAELGRDHTRTNGVSSSAKTNSCASGGCDAFADLSGCGARARRGVLSAADKDLCLRLYETADARGDGALTAVHLAGTLQRHAFRVRAVYGDDDAREIVCAAKHQILSSLKVLPHDRLSPAHFVELLSRQVQLQRQPSPCLRLAMLLDGLGALQGKSADAVVAHADNDCNCSHCYSNSTTSLQQRSHLLGAAAVRTLYRLFASVLATSRHTGRKQRRDSMPTVEFVEQVAFMAVKTYSKPNKLSVRSAPAHGGGRGRIGSTISSISSSGGGYNDDDGRYSGRSSRYGYGYGWVCTRDTLRVLHQVDPGRTGQVDAAMLVAFVEANRASQRHTTGAGDMLLGLAGCV